MTTLNSLTPSIDYAALEEKTSTEFVLFVKGHLINWSIVNILEKYDEDNGYFHLFIVCKIIMFVFHYRENRGTMWCHEMYRDDVEQLIKLSGGNNLGQN